MMTATGIVLTEEQRAGFDAWHARLVSESPKDARGNPITHYCGRFHEVCPDSEAACGCWRRIASHQSSKKYREQWPEKTKWGDWYHARVYGYLDGFGTISFHKVSELLKKDGIEWTREMSDKLTAYADTLEERVSNEDGRKLLGKVGDIVREARR